MTGATGRATASDDDDSGRRFTVGRSATAALAWGAATALAGFLTGAAWSAGAWGRAVALAAFTVGAAVLAARAWRRQADAPRLTVRIAPWPPKAGAMINAAWVLEDPAGRGLSVAARLTCTETSWQGGGEDQLTSESVCLVSLPLLHAPSGAPWSDGVEHVHLERGVPASFRSSARTVDWALQIQAGAAERLVRFKLRTP